MILDEAIKHLLLGRCVGRYTVPGMKLKLVSKDEVPGLRDEDLDKLKGYNLSEFIKMARSKIDETLNDKF